MKKTRKKGFTIVELVIVIAVIAILAAVLIPTFSNVISNAKVSAAQADAKNLWTQYCVDNAETLSKDVNGHVQVKKDDTNWYLFKVVDGQLEIDSYVIATTNTLTIDGYTPAALEADNAVVIWTKSSQ